MSTRRRILVLQIGQRDVRGRPLCERREILEDLFADVDMVLPCRQLPDDGSKAWAKVEERGYEAMVAKDRDPRTDGSDAGPVGALMRPTGVGEPRGHEGLDDLSRGPGRPMMS